MIRFGHLKQRGWPRGQRLLGEGRRRWRRRPAGRPSAPRPGAGLVDQGRRGATLTIRAVFFIFAKPFGVVIRFAGSCQ